MSIQAVCCEVFGEEECDPTKAVKLSFEDLYDKLDKGYAVYEVLEAKDRRRIYLDVENVNLKEEELEPFIIKLIEDFKSQFCLVTASARVTINVHSRHPGFSFHIIFNRYVIGYQILRNMTRFFLERHPEYKGMIDPIVSNPLQYFRVPLSPNGLSEISYSSNAREHSCLSDKLWKKTSACIRAHRRGGMAVDDFHFPLIPNEYDKNQGDFYITNIELSNEKLALYHNVFPDYNWKIDIRLAKSTFGLIEGFEDSSRTSRTAIRSRGTRRAESPRGTLLTSGNGRLEASPTNDANVRVTFQREDEFTRQALQREDEFTRQALQREDEFTRQALQREDEFTRQALQREDADARVTTTSNAEHGVNVRFVSNRNSAAVHFIQTE